MAQVPEKVLAWLYSILHDYNDVQRTYSDTVRVLSAYPSLSPRTDTYTYDNGSPALLLTLSGTLPVVFRGTTYRFPVQVWIPRNYPQEPPMVYVTPSRDMVIRPGQHVGVDGRVYHHYLKDWGRMWDRASIAESLSFLQQVFTKEPPVISRAQQQQYQRTIGQKPPRTGANATPPQLPPKQRVGGPELQEVHKANIPPPRPPKPGDELVERPPRVSSRSAQEGPPLPPLPHKGPAQNHTYPQQHQDTYADAGSASQSRLSNQQQIYQNGMSPGPPLRTLAVQDRRQPVPQQQPAYEPSPVSPISPMHGYSELPEIKFARSAPPQQHQAPLTFQSIPNRQLAPHVQPAFHHQHLGQTPIVARPDNSAPQQTQYTPNQPTTPARKQPTPDLLSDPFDVALPDPATTAPSQPAPPIPPNPEKEHLLSALSKNLTERAQQTVAHNLSALAPLQAQHSALRAAHANLQAELSQLQALDRTLTSNESILHSSLQACDRAIAATKSTPPPPIDEVLIAPTLVANQLWTLCAEEQACREAMYVLQKALDRGRIEGSDFVRQMRSLGREGFLKMALARKCARGLGLETVGVGVK